MIYLLTTNSDCYVRFLFPRLLPHPPYRDTRRMFWILDNRVPASPKDGLRPPLLSPVIDAAQL